MHPFHIELTAATTFSTRKKLHPCWSFKAVMQSVKENSKSSGWRTFSASLIDFDCSQESHENHMDRSHLQPVIHRLLQQRQRHQGPH